ncbi:DUF6624 domain-containing protein [Elizabethkingia occulta]|uniref:Uncharacterized protein n=1 Tax=Elizabethkingia occulta TaxID=1867263 RepID=A0A1T3MTH5_9FLAO|nr:DUF6624 domain-containing protein [Elizabethkingia occulta]OPB91074.1 hypothetical protein BB020_12055 [Elizabethkingia occulta]OPC67908.1 hypothetical protein BAZ10_15040 [Elizabethkingia occulta]
MKKLFKFIIVLAFPLFFKISFAQTTKITESEKELINRTLSNMVDSDQLVSLPPSGENSKLPKETWRKMQDSVYSSNKVVINEYYKKFEFLGFDKVGKEGSYNFWLLVQHCDKYPEFQKKILKSMKIEVEKKNAQADNYALLYDRVRINSDKKQLFGSQVTYNELGQAEPKNGLIDSINVDAIRKRYDLEPIKDYLNSMTERHYEMNKEYFTRKGINAPKLYN